MISRKRTWRELILNRGVTGEKVAKTDKFLLAGTKTESLKFKRQMKYRYVSIAIYHLICTGTLRLFLYFSC